METRDYIDANVIVEVLLEGRNKDICSEYLYSLVRYKDIKGLVSFLALGEITNALLKIKDLYKRNLAFDKLSNILLTTEFTGFYENTFNIALELINMDYRLKDEPADSFHLAIAINKVMNRFITMEDKKFNQYLRDYINKNGLKIITLKRKEN